MSTLADVISTVSAYLRDMGHVAYSLKISSFDTTSEHGAWKVSGTFQGGFMGDDYRFDIVYEPGSGTARKMDVAEIS